MNLPLEITISIISKLPIRSILVCRSVCKQWLDVISSSYFTKTHLSSSTPGLIVHQVEDHHDSCKLLQFDDAFELQDHDFHYNLLTKFDPRSFISTQNAKIVIAGSVNGLLLLRDYSTRPADSLYICNPITREFISLPAPELTSSFYPDSHFGFGVSPISNEYKVVWNFHEFRPCFESDLHTSKCLVYTIGKGCWRSIKPLGSTQSLRSDSVQLHGNLYWLVQDFNGSHLISCFDLETELFKPFSDSGKLPPYPSCFPDSRSLVILQDHLCLCEYDEWDSIVVWMMMKDQSWRRYFGIELTFRTTCETIYPIKVFRDGDILLLWEDFELFYFCNKTKRTQPVKAFEMVHFNGWTEAMMHTPSFVSLRHFSVENVVSF